MGIRVGQRLGIDHGLEMSGAPGVVIKARFPAMPRQAVKMVDGQVVTMIQQGLNKAK